MRIIVLVQMDRSTTFKVMSVSGLFSFILCVDVQQISGQKMGGFNIQRADVATGSALRIMIKFSKA